VSSESKQGPNMEFEASVKKRRENNDQTRATEFTNDEKRRGTANRRGNNSYKSMAKGLNGQSHRNKSGLPKKTTPGEKVRDVFDTEGNLAFETVGVEGKAKPGRQKG